MGEIHSLHGDGFLPGKVRANRKPVASPWFHFYGVHHTTTRFFLAILPGEGCVSRSPSLSFNMGLLERHSWWGKELGLGPLNGPTHDHHNGAGAMM